MATATPATAAPATAAPATAAVTAAAALSDDDDDDMEDTSLIRLEELIPVWGGYRSSMMRRTGRSRMHCTAPGGSGTRILTNSAGRS
jgi:hypothetical protein